MILIAPIYLDASILPHFLRHYTSLGITAFYFSVNRRLNPDIPDRVRELSRGFPACVDAVYDIDDVTAEVAKHLNRIREEHCDPDEWISVVDLDELYDLPQSLAEFLRACDELGVDHVMGEFIDRVAADGSLPAVRGDREIAAQFPLRRRLTRHLVGGNDTKVVLQKGRHEIVRGHHRIVGGTCPHPVRLPLNHYKWKEGVVERLEERLRVQEKLDLPWARESRAFLAYYREHGHIDIDDSRFFVENGTGRRP